MSEQNNSFSSGFGGTSFNSNNDQKNNDSPDFSGLSGSSPSSFGSTFTDDKGVPRKEGDGASFISYSGTTNLEMKEKNQSPENFDKFQIGSTVNSAGNMNGVLNAAAKGGKIVVNTATSSLDDSETVQGYKHASKAIGASPVGILGSFIGGASDKAKVESSLSKFDRKFKVSSSLYEDQDSKISVGDANKNGPKKVDYQRASSADIKNILMTQGVRGAGSYRVNTGNLVSDFNRDYSMVNQYLLKKGIDIDNMSSSQLKNLVSKRTKNPFGIASEINKFSVGEKQDISILLEAIALKEQKDNIDKIASSGGGLGGLKRSSKTVGRTVVENSDVYKGYNTATMPYKVAKTGAKLGFLSAGGLTSLSSIPVKMIGGVGQAGEFATDFAVKKFKINGATADKWNVVNKKFASLKEKSFKVSGKMDSTAKVVSKPFTNLKGKVKSGITKKFGNSWLFKKMDALKLVRGAASKWLKDRFIFKAFGMVFKAFGWVKYIFLMVGKFLLITVLIDLVFLVFVGMFTSTGVSTDGKNYENGVYTTSYNQHASNEMYKLQYAHQVNMGNAMLLTQDGKGSFEHFIDKDVIAAADIKDTDRRLLNNFLVYAESNPQFGKDKKKEMLKLYLKAPVILQGIPTSWKDQLNGNLAESGEKGATAEKFSLPSDSGTEIGGVYKKNIDESDDYYASIFEDDINTAIYTENGIDSCEPSYDTLKGINLKHYWGPPVCAYTASVPGLSHKCYIREREELDDAGHVIRRYEEKESKWHWCTASGHITTTHPTEVVTITGSGGLEGYLGNYDLDAYDDNEHGNKEPRHNRKAIYKANTGPDYIFVQHDSDGYKNLGKKENENVIIRYLYTGSAYSYEYTETKYFAWTDSKGNSHKYNIKDMYKAMNAMLYSIGDNSITNYSDKVAESKFAETQHANFEGRNRAWISQFVERLYWQAIDGYHSLNGNMNEPKPNTRILLKTVFKKNDALKVNFEVYEESSETSKDHPDEFGDPAIIKKEHPIKVGKGSGDKITGYDAYVYLDIVMSCTGLQDLINIDSGYDWDGSKPPTYDIHNDGGFGTTFSSKGLTNNTFNNNVVVHKNDTLNNDKRGPLTTPEWCKGEKDCSGKKVVTHGTQYFHSEGGESGDEEEVVTGKFGFNWYGWYSNKDSNLNIKSFSFNEKLKKNKDNEKPTRALEQALTLYEMRTLDWEDAYANIILPSRPTDIDDLDSLFENEEGYKYVFDQDVLDRLTNNEFDPEKLAELLKDAPNVDPMLMEYLNQANSNYKDWTLGNSGVTVKKAGCLVSCIAMITSMYKNGSAVDLLRQICSDASNFSNSGDINSNNVISKMGLNKGTVVSGQEATIKNIQNQLSKGIPVILRIKGQNLDTSDTSLYHASSNSHYLVVTGCSSSGFTVKDPGKNANNDNTVSWDTLYKFSEVSSFGVTEK